MILILIAIASGALGIVFSAFLMVSAWFAWTPLAMIFRMPVGLLATLPFGVVAAATTQPDSSLVGSVFAMLLFALVSLFWAERSWTYAGCLFFQVMLGVYLGLSIALSRTNAFEKLDFSMISYGWIVMLALSTIMSLPRWFGFRLRRIMSGFSDQEINLSTGKSIDEWIAEIDMQSGVDWNHADTMNFLKTQGVPFDLRKPLTNAVFRLLGKPTPRLGRCKSSSAFANAIQWATTGSEFENQYSTRQLIFWITSAAILFALLSRNGISPDFLSYAWVLIPTCFTLALGVVAMAVSVLMSHESFSHRVYTFLSFAMIGFSFLLLSSLIQLGAGMTPVIAAAAIGSGASLWLWTSYLRLQGFRLMRSASKRRNVN